MSVADPLVLRRGDGARLRELTRTSTVPAGHAQRARMLLLAAEGLSHAEVGRWVGMTRQTVIAWWARYTTGGLEALADFATFEAPVYSGRYCQRLQSRDASTLSIKSSTMSSETLKVSVIARARSAVTLRVIAAQEDDWSEIPADESLALMLLYPAFGYSLEYGGDGCPLAGEVSSDDLLDKSWQQRYARGFVRSVHAMERTGGSMPSALLHVEVTDPAWIEHLNEGMHWGSVAFAVVDRYHDCLPVTFQTTAED